MPDMAPNIRKGVNILFNRATNDMDLDSDTRALSRELIAQNVEELACDFPDCPPNYFPCLEATKRAIAPLLKANKGRWIDYAANMARSLWGYKIVMPLIVDPDGIVVNGIVRLQLLAERKRDSALCVQVDHEQADFGRAMLNLLSMDFDIHTRYADVLRFNSFRRARRSRKALGRGFVFAIIGNRPAYNFDIYNPKDRARWQKKHGRAILDFGAGHLHEADMLRDNGFDVTPFEPYRLGRNDTIDKAESLHLARAFLDAIAAGKRWSSIFISSVLNSVPFESDRIHILRICAACCGPRTRVYAVAQSDKEASGPQQSLQKKYIIRRSIRSGGVALDYEKAVMLSDIQKLPKTQKYHTPRMFYDLFKKVFETVQVAYDCCTNVRAIAAGSLGVGGLREALEFEFDLPYPDGSQMGLATEAIAAFEKRLEVKL